MRARSTSTIHPERSTRGVPLSTRLPSSVPVTIHHPHTHTPSKAVLGAGSGQSRKVECC